jgi:hypothetical protein
MKKIIILIVISLILINCSSRGGPEFLGYGEYMQTDSTGDTAWWTFTEDGKLLYALKRKVRNAEGHMPVEHWRGGCGIEDDTLFEWTAYSNVVFYYDYIGNWDRDPMHYKKITDYLHYNQMRVIYWDGDSICMETLVSPWITLEAVRSTSGSLLSSGHSAYREL